MRTTPLDFEASWALRLGETVAPKVWASGRGFYISQYLQPVELTEDLPQKIEYLLETRVWNRAPHHMSGESDWRPKLHSSTALLCPDWAMEKECLIHGDPTFANTLQTEDGEIRLCDGVHPINRYCPQIAAVDKGRILQSMLGWEIVSRGDDFKIWSLPKFLLNSTSAPALFWCIVALRRLVFHNYSTHITKWAKESEKRLRCFLSF